MKKVFFFIACFLSLLCISCAHQNPTFPDEGLKENGVYSSLKKNDYEGAMKAKAEAFLKYGDSNPIFAYGAEVAIVGHHTNDQYQVVNVICDVKNKERYYSTFEIRRGL